MYHQGIPIEFHEAMRNKGSLDTREIQPLQFFQVGICDVSRGNQKQTGWLSGKQKRLHEIVIFGHHDALLATGAGDHLGIRSSIAQGQIQRVLRVMPGFGEPKRHSPWQLRINQKFHAARRSSCFTCARRAA